ncbi:hypothetical protein OG298_00575 [Streptomyces sp. NBC_01005]|uniref:hypothetical protein n=1 Tax=Streptomyces sp. NBC_01005 TaxID=2903715 RepID=UPI00386B31F5|nr:hypothetical protein OG298_00575 [Streptomyces sp. NBC_01005]
MSWESLVLVEPQELHPSAMQPVDQHIVRHARVRTRLLDPSQQPHLVNVRGYKPWGIVIGRDQMFLNGGGAVAYVPDDVYATFKTQGLEHWVVRTGVNSTWMHEREWRLATKAEAVQLNRLRAILIGDKDWRPSLVDTGEWINGETGEQCQGPAETPAAQPRKDYPKLWRETEIWVWDAERKTVVKHPPGTLR